MTTRVEKQATIVQAIAAVAQTIVVILGLYLAYVEFFSDEAKEASDNKKSAILQKQIQSQRSFEMASDLISSNSFGSLINMLTLASDRKEEFRDEFETENKNYILKLHLLASCVESELCDESTALNLTCREYGVYYFTIQHLGTHRVTPAVKRTIELCSSPKYYNYGTESIYGESAGNSEVFKSYSVEEIDTYWNNPGVRE